METYNLENGRRSDNPIKSQIGDLIGKIGSPSFEPSFFQIVREATACEHVTAFASSDQAPARLLFALNRGTTPVARIIANKYLEHYWNHDPANLLCRREAAPNYEMAVRVFCQDIDHDAYRRDCYSSVDLIDRFSIIKRHGAETIRLNLYRSAKRGRFVVTDFAGVLECADVMFALLAKHDAQRSAVGQNGEFGCSHPPSAPDHAASGAARTRRVRRYHAREEFGGDRAGARHQRQYGSDLPQARLCPTRHNESQRADAVGSGLNSIASHP